MIACASTVSYFITRGRLRFKLGFPNTITRPNSFIAGRCPAVWNFIKHRRNAKIIENYICHFEKFNRLIDWAIYRVYKTQSAHWAGTIYEASETVPFQVWTFNSELSQSKGCFYLTLVPNYKVEKLQTSKKYSHTHYKEICVI